MSKTEESTPKPEVAETPKTETSRKSIVAVVMDAMNIPENEIIEVFVKPVAEGEVVVGVASLTVRRLFTASEQIAIGLRQIIAKYQDPKMISDDLAISIVTQGERDLGIAKKLNHMAWEVLDVEMGDPMPNKSYGLRKNWQIVAVSGDNGHDCNACQKQETCLSIKGRSAPGARKSPVDMIREALAIPENEIDEGTNDPVEEGETVIGTASLVVRQLSFYRTKLVDVAQGIEAKYPDRDTVPSDILNDILVRHNSALKGAVILESLIWNAIETDTNEFKKPIGLRKDWQIVAVEPKPRMGGVEIIFIGSDGTSNVGSLDDLIDGLFN